MQTINPLTTTDYDFRQWFGVNGVSSFVFLVRAANDAHLAFGHVPGNFDVDTYQLVIGGNYNQDHFLRDGLNGVDLKVFNIKNIAKS